MYETPDLSRNVCLSVEYLRIRSSTSPISSQQRPTQSEQRGASVKDGRDARLAGREQFERPRQSKMKPWHTLARSATGKTNESDVAEESRLADQ